MADQPITQDDIQSLAQKLSQFTQSLTPGEQAALATVVMRGASEDVAGYSVAPNAREHPTDPDNDDDDDNDYTAVVTVLKPFIRKPTGF
jgi:hypothetical protein